MSWLPVVSQAKSFFQWVGGDSKGAEQTQKEFLRTCPVFSQGTSLYYYSISGNKKEAQEVQLECGKAMLGVVDGIPVLGHAKGAIHYVAGQKEEGDRAMKSASRSVGVIAGGAGGFLIGGPPGAVAGGIVGGAAMDGITTRVESAIHQEFKPNGYIAQVDTITEKIKNGDNVSGDVFDIAASVVFDGLTGHAVGKVVQKIQTARVYRVTGAGDVETAIKDQNLPRGFSQTAENGETWVSQSSKHARAYLEQKTTAQPDVKFEIIEMKVPKKGLSQIKQNSIPAEGSKAVNQGNPAPKNLLNSEKLSNHPTGKVNIGLKGDANLQEFNALKPEIRRINPNDLRHQNQVVKQVSRYGTQGGKIVVANAKKKSEQEQEQ